MALRIRDEGGVLLEVADDGAGPAATPRGEASPGLGTGLVRRLARQIGAEFACMPGEGGGTMCRVAVPA